MDRWTRFLMLQMPVHSNAWVGLDLGSAVSLAEIKYTRAPGAESRMVGGYFETSNQRLQWCNSVIQR